MHLDKIYEIPAAYDEHGLCGTFGKCESTGQGEETNPRRKRYLEAL